MSLENTLAYATQADAADVLPSFRSKFAVPQKNGKDVIYFCGNSLGLMPRHTTEYVNSFLHDWQMLGVEGHVHGSPAWVDYHMTVRDASAYLIGAMPEEVIIMNALTVNLHLMLVSFYRPEGRRRKILMEGGSFPSDRYAVESQIKWHGGNPETDLVEIFPREGEFTLRTEDILARIETEGDELAAILFGGINYYTGQVFDMEAITRAGHAVGATVGFDLAHAAGNIPMKMHDWGVDFAVWCTYKYLNAGPGAIAGAFVHEKYAQRFDLPRLTGWFSNRLETRFLMRPELELTPGAEGWMISNVPILSMIPLRASLEIFNEAGWERLNIKSKALTSYLEFVIRDIQHPDLQIITPPDERGAQLSLYLPSGGKAVFRKLTEAGVVADWREPAVIRIAPVPLYNTFTDVYHFGQILKEAL
jgi:kynureninase